MMQMPNKAIYCDAWALHAEVEKAGARWDRAFWPKADAIIEKHNYDSFCVDLLLAIFEELARTKGRKAESGPGECMSNYTRRTYG